MTGLALALLLLAGPLPTGSAAQEPPKDPDLLYADRDHLPSARAAADIWEARLAADAKDFEAAWKLARACYWLGGHVPQDERRQQYERGIEAGRRAIALEPDRPDGYFWMAADMGAMAESSGLIAGIRYRGAVKEALETVLRLDPSYQLGSADRALGRWYFRVPRLFGGNKDRAIEHLQRSLTYAPQSTASHFFLAESLLEKDRLEEAARHARAVLDAPTDPDWAPEDREFKEQAARLLARLETRLRSRP